jgi:rod shape-determining protein MreC
VVNRVSPQLRTTIQRATLPLLVLLSAVIVILGKADRQMLDSLRTTVADDAAPVLGALSRPVVATTDLVERVRGMFEIYEANSALTQENRRLLQWQQAALNLAAENNELRGLLRLVPKEARSFVTARVIATSGGAYVRSLLINAGSDNGVARGQAAITGGGLVGRLTEVGTRAARILLITDLNSRIPVVVQNSRQSAVLAGDNSEQPRLLYLTPPTAVAVGDRIVTSGEGGIFPPGLPVGIVASIEGGVPRIEPYVELSQIGYVRIVNYGLTDTLPKPIPARMVRVRTAVARAPAARAAAARPVAARPVPTRPAASRKPLRERPPARRATEPSRPSSLR